MSIMALPTPFILRREAFRDRRATLALGLLGLADAANTGLYFASVQRGPVTVAVLTHYIGPLFIALAAPWVLRERRSVRALIGVPLTLLGLALLLGTPKGGLDDPWTALLGGGSAFFFMVCVFASRAAARAYSPLAITALHSLITALVLLLVFGRDALPPSLDSRVLLVVAGGVLCGIGGNSLFYAGLRHIPTAATGAISYLEPLTAALLGLFVFGEALGPLAALGGLIVLVSGAWVASEPRGPASSAPASQGYEVP
jgi:drug/metabolite transporter (DMT)-like permease